MSKLEELTKIQDEVKEMDKQILEICKSDKEIDSKYTGIEIYFSPLVVNPTIMLLGINTGAGYLKWCGKRPQEFGPRNKMDYIENLHPFARQNRKLFESIGRIDLLENAFKTNLYYIGTEKQEYIEKLFTSLQKITGIDYYKKFHQYTKTFIENIKPKILICEGRYVFDCIKFIYNIEEKNIRKFDGKIPDAEITVTKLNDIHVIGYNRRSSSIINRDKLAEVLKQLIDDNKL